VSEGELEGQQKSKKSAIKRTPTSPVLPGGASEASSREAREKFDEGDTKKKTDLRVQNTKRNGRMSSRTQ